jgi:hypothetical protein
LQNTFAILQHVGIPKPQDPIALRSEPSIACDIPLGFSVLTAIDFNHQHALMTHEIENERSERNLAPETQPVQAMGPQPRPQMRLRVGHVTPQ